MGPSSLHGPESPTDIKYGRERVLRGFLVECPQQRYLTSVYSYGSVTAQFPVETDSFPLYLDLILFICLMSKLVIWFNYMDIENCINQEINLF